MEALAELPLSLFANASATSNVMRSYIVPIIATLSGLASLGCVFFLINGGIQYMTSSGDPAKLEHAKKVIKNALIGLVLVLAAATLTGILSSAYSSSNATPAQMFPELRPIEPADDNVNLWDVFVKAIVGFLRSVVESVAEPFLNALSFFLNRTPLMGENASVFNLWLAVVGIADVLFILVVALLGFNVMSASTFGFEEVDIKQLLPRLALIFLLINTSIFAIDAVIGLSNGMIYALQSGFPSTDVWQVLANITKESSTLGVAGLLVMVALLVLTVMLLVYYILRLVTLYIGAILSPLVLLLWLLPSFKDFAVTALKTYLTTIFVLFVHVVILLLAASIFTGMLGGDNSGQPNTLMALLVGLATVVALLKTQGVMQELSYAASAPRAARELSGSFIRGMSYMNRGASTGKRAAGQGAKGTKKVVNHLRDRAGNINKPKPKTPAKQKQTQNKGGTTRIHSIESRPARAKPLKTGETRQASRPKKQEKA